MLLADTGCGHDLVSSAHVKMAKATSRMRLLHQPIELNTAGGLTKCVHRLEIQCPALDEKSFEALVLHDTPAVLSIGKRCVKYGYGFHWPPGSLRPYLVAPSGDHIGLTVIGDIPYLIVPKTGIASPAETRAIRSGNAIDGRPPIEPPRGTEM